MKVSLLADEANRTVETSVARAAILKPTFCVRTDLCLVFGEEGLFLHWLQLCQDLVDRVSIVVLMKSHEPLFEYFASSGSDRWKDVVAGFTEVL